MENDSASPVDRCHSLSGDARSVHRCHARAAGHAGPSVRQLGLTGTQASRRRDLAKRCRRLQGRTRRFGARPCRARAPPSPICAAPADAQMARPCCPPAAQRARVRAPSWALGRRARRIWSMAVCRRPSALPARARGHRCVSGTPRQREAGTTPVEPGGGAPAAPRHRSSGAQARA